MYGVILAGGKGKRFWPVSTESRPKQLIDVSGEGSMLSVTFRRLSAFIPKEKIIVLTNRSLETAVRGELPELDEENIFSEPVGRNTAPSIALASIIVSNRAGDEPFITCPADHLIEKEELFARAAEAAGELSSGHDVLVTFAIEPSLPATGYGYIEAREVFDSGGGFSFLKVLRFHEKPDAKEAERYLEAGSFYWNSGIFVWRPSVFVSALKEHLPQAYEIAMRIDEGIKRGNFTEVMRLGYPKMPSISVDYAVLEKAANVVSLPLDIGWNDVGSWDALYDILASDADGNAVRGEHESIDSKGNLVFNTEGLTALIGVEDLIVVASGGSVLVCKKGMSQEVKKVVERLQSEDGKEAL